jgi:GNAT superfamily N-acetyltransferase
MNNYYEAQQEDYLISTDPAKLDLAVVHGYLSTSYWSENIPFSVVEKSAANSLCFGLYYLQQQIGFARLITDKTTFAYLADVFILETHRGKGLSKWLMKTIHAHPGLQNLRTWLLQTRDAHNLYRQFGWGEHPNPERIMRKANPDIYKKPPFAK